MTHGGSITVRYTRIGFIRIRRKEAAQGANLGHSSPTDYYVISNLCVCKRLTPSYFVTARPITMLVKEPPNLVADLFDNPRFLERVNRATGIKQ
jgi:hypothetical protein